MQVLTLDEIKESLVISLSKESGCLYVTLSWIHDDRPNEIIDQGHITINQLLEP